MRERRLRHLLSGPVPGPDRILYSNLWFPDHNNQRYEQLLPRLERIDAYLFRTFRRRVPRGVQYRAWRATGSGRRVVARGGRRYRAMFTTEYLQIPAFPGPVVVDVDDADFSPAELELFRSPNVRALVTTTPWAAERFRSLGITAPVEVVPQGVTFRGEPERIPRGPGPVLAYAAAWLLAGDDPGADDPLSNVDHLLELWREIHARLPASELWLIGEARDAVRDGDGIRLFGRVPRERVIPILANADVALYPRRRAAGLAVMKISDYVGAGLPVVSYDEERVAAQLAPTGAGIVVSTPREFVDAVVTLDREPLAAAARRAGRELDWDVLARRYETEILDRYLPA